MRKSKVGRLSQRITIQAPVMTPDDAGGYIEGPWQEVATVWAEAKPGISSRVLDMEQTRINCDVTFRIRTRAIGKNNRILYNGRVCNIVGIRDWEQDKEFQFIDIIYADGN